MPSQIISRIICCTNQSYTGLTDQVAHTHTILLQLCIAQIPYFFCSLTIQNTVIAEKSLQFQMTPVIQRITDCFLKRLCPFLELFAIRSTAGDVIFIHTIGTHLAPFVMVTAQPYLCDIFKLSVFRNLLRINMAVVVQNRNLCCKIVIQFLSCLCAQKKIFIHKCFHIFIPPFCPESFAFSPGKHSFHK